MSDPVDILPFLLLPLAGPEELTEEENEGEHRYPSLKSQRTRTGLSGSLLSQAARTDLTPLLMWSSGLPVDLQFLPEDKKREEDPDIRKMLLETLLLV